MKRQPTEQQKAAAAARRERFRQMAKQVAAMTDEQRGQIVSNIGAVPTCEGRALSVFNSCLILSQCSAASMVGGFKQWIKAGRAVKKGEHGLGIWIPMVGKSEEDEAGELYFNMGTVFDISQTQELQNVNV
jgi:hypothetical protein